MNIYTLTFKDINVEKDYQLKNNQAKRVNTFKFVSLGLIVVFASKVLQAALSDKLQKLLEASVITFLLSIQLIFVSFHQQYVRLALVIINHLINIYLFANEEKNDAQMAMLQGVNQMGATYLLVLIGEYLDGVISIVNLSIFRIAWAYTHSSEIQISAIISTTLLMFYINYFNYQFHLGKRSQFLLSFVDTHWEEMMKKLSVHMPYLIIQYQEENLKFLIKQFNKCEKIIQDDSQDAFLDQCQIEGIPLKKYLFQLITSNNKNNNPKIELTLNYQKHSYLIEVCIYEVKNVNLLIIFKDFNQENAILTQNYKSKCNKLSYILMKVLKKYQNMTSRKQQCLQFRRRILIMFLCENIKMQTQLSKVLFLQFLDKALYYCQNLKIKLSIGIPFNQLLNTHPQLFVLLLLIIFDNALDKIAVINCKLSNSQEITLQIKSLFDAQTISASIKPHKKKFDIIFKEITISQTEINLVHTSEIFVPFFIVD